MTEITLTPLDDQADNPAVSMVVMLGRLNIFDLTPQVGVWTVPTGVESFTVQIGGAPATPYTPDFDPPEYPIVQAVFYDVPCTPGDRWLLEPGDPDNVDIARTRGTLHGGQGRSTSPPTPDQFPLGAAGGGASILSRRTTSDEVFAVHGGQGGAGYDLDSMASPALTAVQAPPGPVSYGGFTDLSGAGVGADQTTFYGGGGGGGYPAGAAAGADVTAGESGGSYLPDVTGSSLGGAASPDSFDIASSGTWAPSGMEVGIVAIWYWRPTRRQVWAIDATPF